MALTARQQAFVAAYDGNGTAAARVAGYGGDEKSLKVTASRLLTNANVAAAIHKRQTEKVRPLIATREDRQKFWTEVMQSPEYEPRDRLKASELLGKSEADFTEKLRHEGDIRIAVVDPYAERPGG